MARLFDSIEEVIAALPKLCRQRKAKMRRDAKRSGVPAAGKPSRSGFRPGRPEIPDDCEIMRELDRMHGDISRLRERSKCMARMAATGPQDLAPDYRALAAGLEVAARALIDLWDRTIMDPDWNEG